MSPNQTKMLANKILNQFSSTSYGKRLLQNRSYPVATFGAGCFWGVESKFRKVEGIIGTLVGFMGGTLPNPSYKDVCCKNTGYAEVVHLLYNPEIVSYSELVEIFWKIHNPTTLNQQGPDIGDQYRSVIFYHSDQQKLIAERSKKNQSDKNYWFAPIVTEISPASKFYPAEISHQCYFEKNKRV